MKIDVDEKTMEVLAQLSRRHKAPVKDVLYQAVVAMLNRKPAKKRGRWKKMLNGTELGGVLIVDTLMEAIAAATAARSMGYKLEQAKVDGRFQLTRVR